MAVDPSVPTVLGLLRKHATSMPPYRLIFHYFGHGCHPPTADGNIFFFTDDRQQYKPLKIQNVMIACQCPLCFILDCSNAAVVYPHLESRRDLFAFFACGADELLPISTDAPLDLFSRCLLSPFDASITTYTQARHSVAVQKGGWDVQDRQFLQKFFEALLESVFFDTQPPDVFQTYMRDPAIAALARGFVLAQKVMLAFNLHPVAIPRLEPTSSHYLWDVWAVVLDFTASLPQGEGFELVFDLFVSSFTKFPRIGYFPLAAFLLKVPEFHARTAQCLLDFLDRSGTDADVDAAARSSLPRALLDVSKPSDTSLLILAKILATGKAPPLDQHTPINFAASGNADVLKAGMLALACGIGGQNVPPSFARIAQVCIEHAAECAPFSAILLALIVARAGKLMTVPDFAPAFAPLLGHPRADVRAAAAVLLGEARDGGAAAAIAERLSDPEPIVRKYAVWALAKCAGAAARADVAARAVDEDGGVREAVEGALRTLEWRPGDSPVRDIPSGQGFVLKQLTESVRAPKFVKRMKVNCLEAS
jgi:hypothetical protein